MVLFVVRYFGLVSLLNCFSWLRVLDFVCVVVQEFVDGVSQNDSIEAGSASSGGVYCSNCLNASALH